jgi:hypothetical protein
MRAWIQPRKGISGVQLQIGFLILGTLIAAAWLIYYTASLPR